MQVSRYFHLRLLAASRCDQEVVATRSGIVSYVAKYIMHDAVARGDKDRGAFLKYRSLFIQLWLRGQANECTINRARNASRTNNKRPLFLCPTCPVSTRRRRLILNMYVLEIKREFNYLSHHWGYTAERILSRLSSTRNKPARLSRRKHRYARARCYYCVTSRHGVYAADMISPTRVE